MLRNLKLSRSAIFFKIERALSNSLIERVFQKASENKVGTYSTREIRKKEKIGEQSFVYSLLIFKVEEEPSFLTGSQFMEIKFAFMFLLEIEGFVLIFKKLVPSVEKIMSSYISRMSFEKVQNLFSDGNVAPAYEKLSSSSMSITDTGITRKTVEGRDLNGQISSYSSRRAIPNSATVRTDHGRHVLRPGNSSVSKVDGKTDFESVLFWASEVCHQLKKDISNNAFFDSFAKPVKFEVVQSQGLEPLALCFNTGELKEILANGGDLSIGDFTFSDKDTDLILSFLDSVFEVEERGGTYYLKHPMDTEPFGVLRVNPKTFSVRSDWLKMVLLTREDAKKIISLQEFLLGKGYFTVNFTNPEYVYLGNSMHQDRGIVSSLEEIYSTISSQDFQGIFSEKGQVSKGQNVFENSSVFSFYESMLANKASFLACDDLGDEWADYFELGMDDAYVRLVHCKHGDVSTSASNFHDVIGQGLKNIGRVNFTKQDIQKKLEDKWLNKYSDSQISRIRSGHSEDQILSNVSKIILNTNVRKEIMLVAPFLSKEDIRNEISKIKKNLKPKAHIIQLVWLLTAFVSSCKEQNIVPMIVCSE